MSIQIDMACRVGREELLILHIRAILHEEGTYDMTIIAINLGCQVAFGVLQLLEGGHTTKDADSRQREHKKKQSYGGHYYHPHKLYNSLFIFEKTFYIHLSVIL
jgi:lipopolysaccharide biosynthesis protein